MADGRISRESIRLQMLKEVLGEKTRRPNADITVSDMDDAAIVVGPDGSGLVISSDFVRGTGFFLYELGYIDLYDIGYYLIAANVSDIAAMGAEVEGLLTVIRYNDAMKDSEFIAIFKGMRAAADHFNARIIGGDIGGHSSDVFSATAFGYIDPAKAMLRKNVMPGDILCVTGEIGGAIAAISYFKNVRPSGGSVSTEVEHMLLERWKRPEPRVNFAHDLATSALCDCAMDISDGLKASVDQLSAYSGKHFVVKESSLPIDEAALEVARVSGVDPTRLAVSASVDFELLFCIRPQKLQEIKDLAREHGVRVSVIGEVADSDQNMLERTDGTLVEIPGVGWEQQTDDYIGQILRKGG